MAKKRKLCNRLLYSHIKVKHKIRTRFSKPSPRGWLFRNPPLEGGFFETLPSRVVFSKPSPRGRLFRNPPLEGRARGQTPGSSPRANFSEIFLSPSAFLKLAGVPRVEPEGKRAGPATPRVPRFREGKRARGQASHPLKSIQRNSISVSPLSAGTSYPRGNKRKRNGVVPMEGLTLGLDPGVHQGLPSSLTWGSAIRAPPPP